MKQASKVLKIINFLQKHGYVIVERKFKNKRGNWAHYNLLLIQPIGY